MPQKSRLKLPPLELGPETIGQRIRRLRKKLGLTQQQLAEKMGLLQTLITDFERDQRGIRSDMVVRFALALNVSADELLGLKGTSEPEDCQPSLALARRMAAIDRLPRQQKRALLKTIDMFLKAASVDDDGDRTVGYDA